MKKRYWYRYSLCTEKGMTVLDTNDVIYAWGEAKARNLELRRRLADLRIGKKVIKNRYQIIRKIDKSNQIPIVFRTLMRVVK